MSDQPEHVHKNLQATDIPTRTNDEHIHEEDKQLLHTKRGKLALPKNEENPALSDLKRKRAAAEDGDDQ